MDKINSSYETMLEINAEIFISELVRQQQKLKLHEQIDSALATRNEAEFYRLATLLQGIE